MDKLYYCPKCGQLEKESIVKKYNDKWCSNCSGTFAPKYLPSDEEYESFDLKQPQTFNGMTKEMYEVIGKKYVNVPNNKKFNKAAFDKHNKKVFEYLERGGYKHHIPYAPSQARCPRCGSTSISTQKKGFGVGKAAAGVAVAGPVGAVAGAAGANKVYNICQNCGHKWEPGK